MITVKSKGNFSKVTKYLQKLVHVSRTAILHNYGKKGVAALSAATPVDSGITANSWHYSIVESKSQSRIEFTNSNIQNGVPIAIILQYGHGTGNGGWVQGRDYINPAIQPIFDKISNDAWKEVTSL